MLYGGGGAESQFKAKVAVCKRMLCFWIPESPGSVHVIGNLEPSPCNGDDLSALSAAVFPLVRLLNKIYSKLPAKCNKAQNLHCDLPAVQSGVSLGGLHRLQPPALNAFL